MSYVTKKQLIDRFGKDDLEQLTDRARTGRIDDEVLNRAINDASVTIDSYLRERHTLPLDQIKIDASPLPLKCGDIIFYLLHHRGAPDHVRDNYNDALSWLRDVQKGRASLGVEDTQVASSSVMVAGQGVSGTDWSKY